MEYSAASRRNGKTVLRCLFLCMFALPCDSYKILLLPLSLRSHIFSLTVIGEEFTKRGHSVDILVEASIPISPELASNKSGITIIRYGPEDKTKSADYENHLDQIMRSSIEGNFNFINMVSEMRQLIEIESETLLVGNDQLFEDMVKAKYDLAVVDSVFFARYLHFIPLRLGIPWITYMDILNPYLVRVPWLPSFYSPKPTSYCGRMTFKERIANVFFSLLIFYYPLVPDPSEEVLSVYRKYGDFGSSDDLVLRSLLFIITSDVVLDDPLPFMPNMINAGGLTVKPAKPDALPKEFTTFMDAAKSGVVIISFGSNAGSFPKAVAQKFIDAFSGLPDMHFIWRLKNTDKLTFPKNVMAANWLPQNDLLADPRVQLFITHSGNNGQFEALYHGVPMIGFPLLADQLYNARRLTNRGYGLTMNIRDFTAEELLDNIQKILSDPSYKLRVSLASEIFRSAARSPAERVVDGVEHVLKFGADHLRSAGNDLTLYQYLMLDVLAFITLIVLAVGVAFWKVTVFVIRRAFCRRPKPKSE